MAKEEATQGGIGLFGAVFIVFLVLKLTGYIDWSWWWITAPLWIPFIATIAVLLIAAAVYVFVSDKKYRITRKYKNW